MSREGLTTLPQYGSIDHISKKPTQGVTMYAFNISAVQAAKFANILKLEDSMRVNNALEAMGADLATRSRAADNRKRIVADLFAAVDALSHSEQEAYGDYRTAALWAESLTMATPSIF
jgi:hypothetical protein